MLLLRTCCCLRFRRTSWTSASLDPQVMVSRSTLPLRSGPLGIPKALKQMIQTEKLINLRDMLTVLVFTIALV